MIVSYKKYELWKHFLINSSFPVSNFAFFKIDLSRFRESTNDTKLITLFGVEINLIYLKCYDFNLIILALTSFLCA